MQYILFRNGKPVDCVDPIFDSHGKLCGWRSLTQAMTWGMTEHERATDRVAPMPTITLPAGDLAAKVTA